jgi:hypothetical protein
MYSVIRVRLNCCVFSVCRVVGIFWAILLFGYLIILSYLVLKLILLVCLLIDMSSFENNMDFYLIRFGILRVFYV